MIQGVPWDFCLQSRHAIDGLMEDLKKGTWENENHPSLMDVGFQDPERALVDGDLSWWLDVADSSESYDTGIQIFVIFDCI